MKIVHYTLDVYVHDDDDDALDVYVHDDDDGDDDEEEEEEEDAVMAWKSFSYFWLFIWRILSHRHISFFSVNLKKSLHNSCSVTDLRHQGADLSL